MSSVSQKNHSSLLSEVREKGGFFYLPPRLLLRFTGADRLRYLNGQVTNDVNKLKIGHVMQAGVLTPKGKWMALIAIMMTSDALFVEADESLRDELPVRLERYIVADDVTLEIVEPSRPTLHVFGAMAAHPEIQKIAGVTLSRLGVVGKDIEVEDAKPLFSLFGKEPVSANLLATLSHENDGASLEEKTIDYKKGCYVGQEILSRLRSAGRVEEFLTRMMHHKICNDVAS